MVMDEEHDQYFIQRVVIIEREEETEVMLMKITPSIHYKRKNKRAIEALNTYRRLDQKYDGLVTFYQYNEEFLEGGRYANGKKVSTLTSKSNSNEVEIQVTTCFEVTVTEYQLVYIDGFLRDIRITGQYSYIECSSTGDSSAGGGGGWNSGGSGAGGGFNSGGSGSGGPNNGDEIFDPSPIIPGTGDDDPSSGCPVGYSKDFYGNCVVSNINFIKDIKIDFKDPCIQSESLKVLKYKDEITILINEVFGVSPEINLNIIDDNNLLSDLDGRVDPPKIIYSPFGEYKEFTIRLNRDILSKSSLEYISATIFHEILHIYIFEVENITLNGQMQHQEMAEKYLDRFALMLYLLYNTPFNEGRDLGWGGLKETNAWENYPYKTRVLDMNKKYRDGSKGTKC